MRTRMIRTLSPVRRQPGFGLMKLLDAVGTWQDRARERRQLLSLDDRMLADIGLSRADAEAEYRKPLWRP